MKLISAQELRSTTRPVDDPIAKVIAAINKRVRERHGNGNTDALIGYTGETKSFAELPPVDRDALAQALRVAGYQVTEGPAPKTIKLSWANERED